MDQIFLHPNHPRKYKGPKLPHYSAVFYQLAFGLEHIHSKKLIHRDIKPANVLISVDSATGQVTMKWADFGLSRSVNERGTYTYTLTSGIRGTRNWLAPELLKLVNQFQKSEQPRGTVKSDVFALGLVFACLLLDGKHLYGLDDIQISANILDNNPVNINSKFSTEDSRPKINFQYYKHQMINIAEIHRAQYALELILKMLQSEHSDRPSSSDIVIQLNFIKGKETSLAYI